MNFERIPIVLKRYNFESKMNVCQRYSIESMSANGVIDIIKLVDRVLPWELETFALFSVITLNEYSDLKFENKKSVEAFSAMINSIRNYEHPKLISAKNNNEFADYFLIVTGLTQFQVQENFNYKIYRYSYMFNFINEEVDMQEEFVRHFNFPYNDYKELGLIINFLCANKFLDSKIYKYVILKYRHVVQNLLIDRERFISIQEKITHSIEQYIYGFKYFYQFPFILNNNKIYLPLPHLVMQSITSSLLFRLTEGNAILRSLFGKEVLENYLLHILGLNDKYDKVVAEYKYRFKKNDKRTLDIMLIKDNQCLMLDSKSMVPRLSLRDLTENDMKYTIDRLVQSVVQVYIHITERFQVEYNPFERENTLLSENIFGVVILFEDSFIRREIIMKKAAEVLNIDIGSEKYRYLCSNVKLLSLYQLESMIFQQEDIFQLLTMNSKDERKWFDYTISHDYQSETSLINEINQITNSTQEILFELIEELKKEGLIS